MSRVLFRIISVSVFLGFWVFPLNLAADSLPGWAVPGDKIVEAEGRGIVIRSSPSGARVLVDGIQRGQTPLRLENLRPGQYFFRLEKDGYTARRFRAVVRQGSVLDITIELEEARGKVLVRVSAAPEAPGPEALPFHPHITVDGESGADEVQGLFTLPVGLRTVRVKAFGWEDVSSQVYIEEGAVRTLDLVLKPAVFRIMSASLRRPRFNPGNPGSLGTTELNFEVSAPGIGSFSVYDSQGELIFARDLGPFTGWSQSTDWDGMDRWGAALPDGEYSLVLKLRSLSGKGSGSLEETFTFFAELDSSRDIRPMTLFSAKAGLLFAPVVSLLPPGSFQIEGGLLFGSPPYTEAWKSLPFAAGFRLSPLERLEISAALNLTPVSGESARAAAGGAIKWAFLKPAGGFPGFAAGAVFSWAEKTAATPFGMGSGIELFFPVQLDLKAPFSFLLTPACIWTGSSGFPWEPAPRLLLSGGILARLTYATAGFSVRSEYPLSGEGPGSPSFMICGEIKIFPPPSSLVFSALGGVWIRGSSLGGFGGVGIGLIN
ncbi:MAG: PEGA domain-containing protein [Treponema sp.]|jgi:hypothetical protein|nr:PEGA domain-containing protein [Treponema sp.]